MKESRWRDVKYWRFSDEQLISFVCWSQKRWCEVVVDVGLDHRFWKEEDLRYRRELVRYWYSAVKELGRRYAWDWLNEHRKIAKELV